RAFHVTGVQTCALPILAEVAHRGAADQAVGRLHGDGPDPVVADLLGDLGDHHGVDAVDGDGELERLVDLGHGVRRELHVDHGAGDGDDAAVGQFGVGDGHGDSWAAVW